MKVTNEMVNRFLSWKLPENFYPDGYIEFNRKAVHPGQWPTGTNLFGAAGAKEMIGHILGGSDEVDRISIPRDTAQWIYDEFLDRVQPIKGGMKGRAKARLHFIALRDSLAVISKEGEQ